MRYTFATYVLDTQRHELRQQGVPVPLEHKAYQVLVYLVQQADRLVTKHESLEAVWRRSTSMTARWPAVLGRCGRR